MPLVVDASAGLKWVLDEPDSDLVKALAVGEETLFVSNFWLNGACNVLWLQVRRKLLTPDEVREGLVLLRAQLEPPPTAGLALHDVALEIGLVSISIWTRSPRSGHRVTLAATGQRHDRLCPARRQRPLAEHGQPSKPHDTLPVRRWCAGACSGTEQERSGQITSYQNRSD